jgi:hypothetical protein
MLATATLLRISLSRPIRAYTSRRDLANTVAM